MKRSSKFVAVLVGLLMAACSPSIASAGEGVILAPERLAAKDRVALVSAVAAEKASSPSAFAAVAELRKRMPELDAQKRGRYVPVAAMLKSLGKDALLPMLNELAIDGAPRDASMSASAWLAWRVGLVEAVGMLRDARSAPVLFALVDAPELEAELVRAATSALGKLGTDAAAQKLVSLGKQKGEKQKSVLAGMGDCRRLVVAEALAAALASANDEETKKIVARSLGDVGSAWAWQTPIIAASGEKEKVQRTAAKALVSAYLRSEAEARSALTKAVLMVDAPETKALIEAEKAGRTEAQKATLDELAARFAKSPLHR